MLAVICTVAYSRDIACLCVCVFWRTHQTYVYGEKKLCLKHKWQVAVHRLNGVWKARCLIVSVHWEYLQSKFIDSLGGGEMILCCLCWTAWWIQSLGLQVGVGARLQALKPAKPVEFHANRIRLRQMLATPRLLRLHCCLRHSSCTRLKLFISPHVECFYSLISTADWQIILMRLHLLVVSLTLCFPL